jgi:hypothetical protein
MLKASTGSSRSTAQIARPTCGVVEARSLTTSFDDPQPRFDAKSHMRQTAEKPRFIVPLQRHTTQIPLKKPA